MGRGLPLKLLKSEKNNLNMEYMHNDCKNLYPRTREEFYNNIVMEKMNGVTEMDYVLIY